MSENSCDAMAGKRERGGEREREKREKERERREREKRERERGIILIKLFLSLLKH